MRTVLLSALILFAAVAIYAQHGGKAEPRRISFEIGKTSAAVTGTLRNGQQIDYVFAASQGQTVTVKNSTSSVFDFRIYNEDYFSEGDFDSSRSYTFEVPESGDYLFTVRKKVAGPRSARFSMTIEIK